MSSEKAEAREMAQDQLDDLRADNERLRALIKAQERGNHAETASGEGDFCPWCGVDYRHTSKCPAFTPEGEVR